MNTSSLLGGALPIQHVTPSTLTDALWLQQEATKLKAADADLKNLNTLSTTFPASWKPPANTLQTGASIAALQNAYLALYPTPNALGNAATFLADLGQRLAATLNGSRTSPLASVITVNLNDVNMLKQIAAALQNVPYAAFAKAVADLQTWQFIPSSPGGDIGLITNVFNAGNEIASMANDAVKLDQIADSLALLIGKSRQPAKTTATNPTTSSSSASSSTPWGWIAAAGAVVGGAWFLMRSHVKKGH